MAAPARTSRTPAAVGKALSVKATPSLYDDLAIIVPTGAGIGETTYCDGTCNPR